MGRRVDIPPIEAAPRMVDTVISLAELRRHDGQRGRRMYIACQGVVYDVTDCPKWRTGLHEQLHFPAQDLSSELGDAPHAEEVFGRPCVRRVGVLDHGAE